MTAGKTGYRYFFPVGHMVPISEQNHAGYHSREIGGIGREEGSSKNCVGNLPSMLTGRLIGFKFLQI